MGFGFSQVLPVIIQIWMISSGRKTARHLFDFKVPKIVAIEQPELHLHPGLQALLADVFVRAVLLAKRNNIELKIISETHSETIINRLGFHIYKKLIPSEMVSVIVFGKSYGKNATEISESNYNSDGLLTNWPIGFFEPETL